MTTYQSSQYYYETEPNKDYSQLSNNLEIVASRLEESGLAPNRFISLESGTKTSFNHSQKSASDIEGNYAVYAGNGLVLIDIDDSSFTPNLPKTLTVKSPHSGKHLYYKIQGQISNSVHEWGEIRASNQYVVGPGSTLSTCKNSCCKPENPGFYSIISDRPIATVSADTLKDALSIKESDSPSSSQPQAEYEALEDPREALKIENDMGYSLRKVKAFSPKLDSLLNSIHPKDYPSPSEADYQTMRILYRYRFSDEDIYQIMKAWRGRDKIKERDDYLPRVLQAAKNGNGKEIPSIQPLPRGELLNLLRRDRTRDKRDMIMKPTVSIQTKNDVIEAIRECPKEPFTVRELVDSHSVEWRGAERKSVMKRTRRTLKHLSPWYVYDNSSHGQEGEWITTKRFDKLDATLT